MSYLNMMDDLLSYIIYTFLFYSTYNRDCLYQIKDKLKLNSLFIKLVKLLIYDYTTKNTIFVLSSVIIFKIRDFQSLNLI